MVIADVCGKGIPAALVMTMLRSTFRAEAKNHTYSAKKLLCAVNDSMKTNLDDRSFVTALCLVISPDGTTMTYARAGHPNLLEISPSGKVSPIPCNGIALGLVFDTGAFDAMIDEVHVALQQGSRFLVYTDGLIDATDPQKNNYGFARLQALCAGDTSSNAEALMDRIMVDIKLFCKDAPYHDDLTILAMDVTG
jgi:sigma-B regulation protein RsbU (phosphoserine phosphatase)